VNDAVSGGQVWKSKDTRWCVSAATRHSGTGKQAEDYGRLVWWFAACGARCYAITGAATTISLGESSL